MLTEKDYCDYDTCVALRELGLSFEDASQRFERNILTNRYEEIPRPLLYEAQKWLREEKKIGVFVSGFKNGYTFWVNNLLNGDTLYQGFFDNQTGEKYKSYEEALLEGIKEAIKLLKEERECQG